MAVETAAADYRIQPLLSMISAMPNGPHHDFLAPSGMAAARAMVSRFLWFEHKTPVSAFNGIKRSGLEPHHPRGFFDRFRQLSPDEYPSIRTARSELTGIRRATTAGTGRKSRAGDAVQARCA